MVSRSVRSSIPSGVHSPPSRCVPGRKKASWASACRSSARTRPSASSRPLSGDHSAAVARTCGSRSRTNAASTMRRPATPFGACRGPRAPRAGPASSWSWRRSACRSARAARRAPRRTRRAGAPLDAEDRLQRARRIVDPGMDHAAVVGARLHAGLRLALEHADTPAPGRDRRSGRQAGHTGADDDGIDAVDGSIIDRGARASAFARRPLTGTIQKSRVLRVSVPLW